MVISDPDTAGKLLENFQLYSFFFNAEHSAAHLPVSISHSIRCSLCCEHSFGGLKETESEGVMTLLSLVRTVWFTHLIKHRAF